MDNKQFYENFFSRFKAAQSKENEINEINDYYEVSPISDYQYRLKPLKYQEQLLEEPKSSIPKLEDLLIPED